MTFLCTSLHFGMAVSENRQTFFWHAQGDRSPIFSPSHATATLDLLWRSVTDMSCSYVAWVKRVGGEGVKPNNIFGHQLEGTSETFLSQEVGRFLSQRIQG